MGSHAKEYVFTIVEAFDHIQLLCFQREIYLSNTTNSKREHFIKSSPFTCRALDKFFTHAQRVDTRKMLKHLGPSLSE